MPSFEQCVLRELREVGLPHAAVCGAAQVADCRIQEFALPFPPRSVAFVALPYGGGPGRVARYARGRDYHRVLPELLEGAAERLAPQFPQLRCRGYADISPYHEVEAAARAGLGVRLRNGLLYVEGCGTYCLIGELVMDRPPDGEEGVRPLESPCRDCGRCVAACPSGALERGFAHCLSGVTQQRRELTAEERELIRRTGSIWGCDVCQQVCPLNLERPGEEDPDLSELSGLSDRQFRKKYADRAFSYRGIRPLLRNIALVEGGEESCSADDSPGTARSAVKDGRCPARREKR